MAKAPNARGFTIAERRALTFERVSLYMVFLVALIAAALSFIALRAVGSDAGLGQASFLLPIAIDGFGIACSVGIVRSVASGEGIRDRLSEWVGLFVSLGLSVLGNVHHALKVGAIDLPDYVKIAYSAAIPIIVAYGIHVYGRAMAKGISAHVMADDPDRVHFDLAHLGDHSAPPARAPRPTPRAQAQPAARAVAAPAAAQPSAQPEQVAARITDAPSGLRAAARAHFEQCVRANPTTKPDAKAIHDAIGSDKNPATTRRWVSEWWDEFVSAIEGGRDPIREQLAEEGGRGEVRAATA